MDQTAISVFGFSVILIVLWMIVVLWAASVVRKIYLSTQSKVESPTMWFVWRNNRTGVLMWFLFFLAVCFYTANESAYRPKTIIANPAQHQLDAEMQKLDEMEIKQISPAQSMSPMDTGEDMLKKSERDNQKAREHFNNL
jgi:hypothetical protein